MPILLVAALLAGDDLAVRMAGRGIPETDLVLAFATTPAIARFAEEAVTAETALGATDRAHRIYDAILALKRSGAIVGDEDNSPKARAPKTAAMLLRIARREKGRTVGSVGEGRALGFDVEPADRRAGCYELTVLYLAAARAVGLDTVGVERRDPVGTGQIGHIMAGVRMRSGGPLTVFDLQNEVRGSRTAVRELDDIELAAHHYNHLSVAAFLRGDVAAARRAVDWALLLAPDSPSFLNNRATVLAAEGELVLAVAEASHAAALAPAVPLYRYQLGRLRLAAGDVAGAVTSLGNALQLAPRYGVARRDLGWAYLLSKDAPAAERELLRARRDDPETPEAGLYLGLFYLFTGQAERALEVTAAALKERPEDRNLLALDAMLRGRESPDFAAEMARIESVLTSARAARGEENP